MRPSRRILIRKSWLSFATALLLLLGLPGWLDQYLVLKNRLGRADAIYVLGGDFEIRAPLAAQLYRDGYAPVIVLPREAEPTVPGVQNPTDTTVGILTRSGVPADRIRILRYGQGVSSTADEGRAFRIYAHASNLHRALLVTSAHHTRRASLVMARALRESNVSMYYAPAEDTGRGLRRRVADISKESVKLVYYALTYWP